MILPGAVDRRPIPNKSGGLQVPCLGVVMHITGSSYSAADGWFHNPSAQASAHLIIDYDGTIYQEVDFNDKAWAEAAGNPYYYSIETAGVGGPLTNAQVLAFARAYAWLQAKDGFPFVLAEAPGQHGLGWHGMGGSAWGGHPYCPGDPRKAQRPLILQLAQNHAQPPQENKVQPVIDRPLLKAGEGICIDFDDLGAGAAGWRYGAVRLPFDYVGGPTIANVRVAVKIRGGGWMGIGGDSVLHIDKGAPTPVIGIPPNWERMSLLSLDPPDSKNNIYLSIVLW